MCWWPQASTCLTQQTAMVGTHALASCIQWARQMGSTAGWRGRAEQLQRTVRPTMRSCGPTAAAAGTGKLNGRSEQLLGRFLKEYPGSPQAAANVRIATKLAAYPWRLAPSQVRGGGGVLAGPALCCRHQQQQQQQQQLAAPSHALLPAPARVSPGRSGWARAGPACGGAAWRSWRWRSCTGPQPSMRRSRSG